MGYLKRFKIIRSGLWLETRQPSPKAAVASSGKRKMSLKWKKINQHFLKNHLIPKDGVFCPVEEPGLNMALNEELIESEEEIFPPGDYSEAHPH